jgi:hypothetical protein
LITKGHFEKCSFQQFFIIKGDFEKMSKVLEILDKVSVEPKCARELDSKEN